MMIPENIYYISLVIFIITYTGIIFTRLPWVNIDRPSAAFFGAVAMILFGVLSPSEALAAIDFNTISLLLGMMIIIVTLQLDGFFNWIARQTIYFAKNQRRLLTIIVFVTGITSAFMVNDAVVLMLTPVIILICKKSQLNPIPYLIAEILASNTGSVMTITGNPQNMLIGMSSGISYADFIVRLMPISILGMFSIIAITRIIYRKEFIDRINIADNIQEFESTKTAMRFSVPIFILVVLLFFFGEYLSLSIPLIALCGASLIMLAGKEKPSKIIHEIDWVLLLFFTSLFVVVYGIEKTGVLNFLLSTINPTNDIGGIVSIHGISLVASQIVSNVPFTVAILPFMQGTEGDLLWLTLASASTLAGNATIIGAVANLIVIESAKKSGIKIGFFEFLKSGLITTLITFVISTFTLYIEYKYFGL